MKEYLKKDAWKIIEEGFHADHNKISESIFSIGNGKFGQRGMIEESFSGPSLLGNYVAGVYYPDKTLVGWWKNGYPEYYAKVINAMDWSSVDFAINGQQFDLSKAKIHDFYRELDMKNGKLLRTCSVEFNGVRFFIESERFISIFDDKFAAMTYALHGFSEPVTIDFSHAVDFDVKNEDSNYDEKFWNQKEQMYDGEIAILSASTKKTDFSVACACHAELFINGKIQYYEEKYTASDKKVHFQTTCTLQAEDSLELLKKVIIVSSLDYSKEAIEKQAKLALIPYLDANFSQLAALQSKAWADKWYHADIQIEGDIAAQQAIRFNIFQLQQTYTGEDSRLNIGPKGFTGEKYGGSTYWDTEAYCIPFYLSSSDESVARQLLIYRYNQLDKAYENAKKIGFNQGEALYPMVTMNGEECHNEWEITFEEIHRNGAIAYAIFDYINYTGDEEYMAEYGLKVLIGIARFWASRTHYSSHRKQYVILGVTGPNEYENNVNNNWYTNYIATWCLRYTIESIEKVSKQSPDLFLSLTQKLKFQGKHESKNWQDIIQNMYLPENKELGIVLQQDNYLDKEQIMAKDLAENHKPLNQHWSWDRILRSCFIKQADVLQGMYFFEHEFDKKIIKRNFEFYEPRTVHESSLSPCVHSILAASIGMPEKAYEMYLRTARLDLDDYNNDTEDGLHITSMAGTWMSIVRGFAGLRVYDNQLQFKTMIPDNWDRYSFHLNFRKRLLKVNIQKDAVQIELLEGEPIEIKVNDQLIRANQVGVLS